MTADMDLRLGDCLEVMAAAPQGSVNVIVTSPPYNLGIDYGSFYDDSIPRANYLDWLGRWANQVPRVLAEEGSLFINLGGKPSDCWGPIKAVEVVEEESGLRLQNIIHWIKSIAIDGKTKGHVKPINSTKYINDAHEYIFHFTRTGEVTLDRLAVGVPYTDVSNLKRDTRGKNGNLRCRGNTWFIPYETIQSRDKDRPHPATFPVALPEMCIKLHGVERCRLVLDPFMGIGTTGLACQKLGVNFLGVEINPEYFKEAQRRLMLAQVEAS